MRKIFWVFFLAVALIFVQGARLHVHFYDHDPALLDHAYHQQTQAHFNYDSIETGHHDEVAEVDLSQQGFVKKTSLGTLLMALFTAVLVILLLGLISRIPWRYDRRRLIISWPFSLRPPLRAPPA